jgi:hypothetical protein
MLGSAVTVAVKTDRKTMAGKHIQYHTTGQTQAHHVNMVANLLKPIITPSCAAHPRGGGGGGGREMLHPSSAVRQHCDTNTHMLPMWVFRRLHALVPCNAHVNTHRPSGAVGMQSLQSVCFPDAVHPTTRPAPEKAQLLPSLAVPRVYGEV